MVLIIIVILIVVKLMGRGKAAQKPSESLGKVIAQVDGLKLYEKDLEFFRGAGYRWTENEKKDFVKQWTRYALLYLAAKESGFADDPLIKRKLQLNSQFALVQEFENRKLQSIQVSATEIDSLYKAHMDKFPYSIDLLIVYAPNDGKRQQVVQMLENKRGSRLFQAVEELKADTSLTVFETGNMNLGVFYLSYNNFNGTLREKVVNLSTGQIDCVPVPDGGYICAFVLSKQKSPQVDEFRLKNFIHQYILTQKQKALEDSLIAEMRQKYEIKIFIDTTKIQ